MKNNISSYSQKKKRESKTEKVKLQAAQILLMIVNTSVHPRPFFCFIKLWICIKKCSVIVVRIMQKECIW